MGDAVSVVDGVLDGDRRVAIEPEQRELREPEAIFTLDPAQNRRSARRFLSLEPKLVCFGHGPPSYDTAAFVEFAEGLSGA